MKFHHNRIEIILTEISMGISYGQFSDYSLILHVESSMACRIPIHILYLHVHVFPSTKGLT